MANNTNVGLAAYFYAGDIVRKWRVAERLEYGIVGINEGIISNKMASFSGVRESGQGLEIRARRLSRNQIHVHGRL